MSEKNLPPTEKRLRDARAEGNVARSEVLAGLAVSVLATEATFACADVGLEHWLAMQETIFARLAAPDRLDTWPSIVGTYARAVGLALAIVASAAVTGNLLAMWACGGIALAPKALKPSLKRLNAARNIKALFSAKNVMAVALAIGAAVMLGATAAWQLRDRLHLVNAMIAWQSLSFDLRASIATLHAFVRTLFIALIVPAAVSAITAKRQHLRDLRMSHRELKDELKQTNGNPTARARQRASLTESVMAPPTRAARGNRALVTNPEHIAVLLHYTGDTSVPPIVIDKATDEHAVRMTDDALLERVPVFRFRRLARHLYRHSELQAAIPAECYRAVAVVYRIVEEIEGLDERPSVPIDIDDVIFDP